MNHRDDDLLRGLRVPRAPDRLRRRALAAARAARAEAPSLLTDSLWESRALRLGWLAATAGLLAINLAIDGEAPRRPAAPRSAAAAVSPEDRELAEMMPPRRSVAATLAEARDLVTCLFDALNNLENGDCT